MHMFREQCESDRHAFREQCALDREKWVTAFREQCAIDRKQSDIDREHWRDQIKHDREEFIYALRQLKDDQCIVKISKDCITQVLANITAVCVGNIIADKYGKYN